MAVTISDYPLHQLINDLKPKFSTGSAYNEILISNIETYLRKIGSNTIVIEDEYVDTHFIDDYCGHYGRCFTDYNRKCVRLHFFEKKFDEMSFFRLLAGPDISMQDVEYSLGRYLGFIVLRPIPSSVFGKICLSVCPDITFPSNTNMRCLSKVISKPYVTHLCGLTFRFYAVAFQEQDHAISACATVALWMGFNAFPDLQPRDVLSPYKISEIVKKQHVEGSFSHIVGKGLNVAQISSVITERALESLPIRPVTFSYAKAVIKAYLSMNIPIILGIDLVKKTDNPEKVFSLGKHAVTVIGFEGQKKICPFRTSQVSKEDDIDIFLESSAIDSLIVHDDQIGPYSKMRFSSEYGFSLTTEWKDRSDMGAFDAFIDVLAIMNIPKVRIRFSTILEQTKELNKLLYNAYKNEGYFISWEIQLNNVCTLKRDVLSNQCIDDVDKIKIVTESLPRYIWTVDLFIRKNNEYEDVPERVATYYYDATDMETAGLFLLGINYNKVCMKITKAVFESAYITPKDFCRSNLQLKEVYSNVDGDKTSGLVMG